MIIDIRKVSCILGNKHVLRDINWTVRPGEHWAIIGLNGSGKTTLLKMINGYVFPSTGEMSVLGKPFGSYDWRELRREVGFISSSLQEIFYANETAKEIVLSGIFSTIGLYDKPKAKDIEKALSLLRQLDCSHAANQPYAELSQGERQKVLIARALISSPKLLIMDEPCAGLDIFSREHLLSSIETLGSSASAPTLIYVSHHIEEILPVFTHTLLLRRGKVHSSGKTGEVLTKTNLSSFFETPVDVKRHKGRVWVDI
ncbi:MAG: ABC transporter ATP-binding protein [Nitrospirae bacterium]|nr:ABC transporter ATP-binding protein [Nitrospirota bacterium]